MKGINPEAKAKAEAVPVPVCVNVPVYCCSSVTNRGIDLLHTMLYALPPSPTDGTVPSPVYGSASTASTVPNTVLSATTTDPSTVLAQGQAMVESGRQIKCDERTDVEDIEARILDGFNEVSMQINKGVIHVSNVWDYVYIVMCMQ